MEDEPLRRSRVLAMIQVVVAMAAVVALVAIHDPDGPISQLPLTIVGLFLVCLAAGAALIGVIRVVWLSIAIRRFGRG